VTQPPPYQQPYQESGQPPYQEPGSYQQQPHQGAAPQGYQQGYQQPYQAPGPYQQQPYQQPGAYQQPQQWPGGYQQQAPQGGYQPYPGQPQPESQAAYRPQGQRDGQATACRICGSAPAARATFRAVVGAVFMHTMWTANGPFCRDCGLHTFRRQTAKTLTGGWCSIGAVILTPIFLLLNIAARGKVAGLPAPQRYMAAQAQAPLDPGPPLFHRPGTYVYPGIVLVLLVAIIVSNLAR
jgi:hypothetical protein